VPDFALTVPRPPSGNLAAAQQSDVAEAALIGVDLNAADKCRAGRCSRPTSTCRFGQSLSRAQHQRGMRGFVEESTCDGSKIAGFEEEDFDAHEFLEGAVPGLRFSQVPGREATRRCAEPPARRRVAPGRLGRQPRTGDSSCKAHDLSRLARDMSRLRATRRFIAMPLTNEGCTLGVV